MDRTDHDDIAFAAPSSLPFADGDISVQVTPAGMGQIARMAAALRPMAGELMALPDDMLQRLMQRAPNQADLAWLFELVCDRMPIAAEVMAIATGIARDRIEALLPDRFVYLAALVYEVNADFFSQAAGTFAKAWARMVAATAMASKASEARAGQKPSTT